MFPPETLWPLEVAAGDPEEPADPGQPAARTAAATQLAAIPRVERLRVERPRVERPRVERPRLERLGVERLGVERLNKRTVAPLSPAALKGNRSKIKAVAVAEECGGQARDVAIVRATR